jgi:hypothetical protein
MSGIPGAEFYSFLCGVAGSALGIGTFDWGVSWCCG